MQDKIYKYLLLLGDNTMVLGHRLSSLCGHGPSLETDIALTNISLDLFGQTRNYFQYAATLIKRRPASFSLGSYESLENVDGEDQIAFLRMPQEYSNVLLVEQPNTDFAYIIVRQFLFDQYHILLLNKLAQSNDDQIAAVANKSIKEVTYHRDFSSQWLKRLGDGTEESHQRMQEAVNFLYPYVKELITPCNLEEDMASLGIGPDLNHLADELVENIAQHMAEATLKLPPLDGARFNGKVGLHSENLGYILSELQYMQLAYPNMKW